MSEETTAPEVTETAEVTTASAPETTSASLDYTTLINSDGTFKEEFYSSLPDDIGAHSATKKYNNIVDLAKGNINASSLVGKKGREYWESEDPAIIAERRDILGIPTEATEYGLQMPEDFPEEIPYDAGELDRFSQFAYENNLTKEQAEAIIKYDAERAVGKYSEVTQNFEAQKQEALENLKSEWGVKTDYNLGKVKQATDELGITDVLNETGLANNASVLRMVFDKLIPAIGDDRLIESAKQDNFATAQDALDDLDDRLMTMDKFDPARKRLLDEKMKLLEKIS